MHQKAFVDLNSLHSPFGKFQSSYQSILLWSCLLAWIVRVTVFLRQRSVNEFTNVDVYAGFQILIVFFLMFLLFINLRTIKIIAMTVNTSVLFLIIYYSICCLSFTWSANPQYSLFRSIEFLVLFISTFAALSYAQNFISAERIFLFISTIVMLLGIYMNFKMTGYSTNLAAFHTNSYTASAAMIFTYCLGEHRDAKGKRINLIRSYLLIGLLGVIIGTSSASILAVIAGVCLVLFFQRRYLLLSFFICVGIAIYFLDFDLSLIKRLIFYGKSEQAIETGTGRYIMWKHYFQVFLDKPILGSGFAVLSSDAGLAVMSSPHNSLLAVALGTGILGLFAVISFLLKLFFELLPTSFKRIPGGVGSAAAIAVGVINSLSNPFIFDRWEESSFTFSCFYAFFILFIFIPYREDRKKDVRHGWVNSLYQA